MRPSNILLYQTLFSCILISFVSALAAVPLSADPASTSGFLMNDTDWVTRSAWNETFYKRVWLKVSIGDDGVGDAIEADPLEI